VRENVRERKEGERISLIRSSPECRPPKIPPLNPSAIVGGERESRRRRSDAPEPRKRSRPGRIHSCSKSSASWSKISSAWVVAVSCAKAAESGRWRNHGASRGGRKAIVLVFVVVWCWRPKRSSAPGPLPEGRGPLRESLGKRVFCALL